MALQLRPRYRRIAANPSLLRLCSFSSSSSSPDPNQSDPFLQNPTNDPSPPDPPASSQFSDVKASLNHLRPATATPPFSRPSATLPMSKAASLAEISRNLSQFRSRTAAPAAGDSNSASSSPISFQALYQKNLSNKDGGTGTGSFDMIRSSLRTLKKEGTAEWGQVRNVESRVVGGSEALPMSVFGKELGEKKHGGGGSEAKRTLFVNMYNTEELGKKLRMLKPEGAEKSGFSLTELSERLNKVREMDEEEQTESRADGVPYNELRASLQTMANEKWKADKTPIRLNVLSGLGGTPDYMVLPPKEHLVEKYFHPDNMSAAEKLKLELQKVREEFKMSESDCGSARVQVAQLTTKIKHLSSVLHKKDKHSRKGLVEMVQRRKKLLKYLRRTDWDSYCFVLSKLGLRDNPDYKR